MGLCESSPTNNHDIKTKHGENTRSFADHTQQYPSSNQLYNNNNTSSSILLLITDSSQDDETVIPSDAFDEYD
jgi:hypothetical protein